MNILPNMNILYVLLLFPVEVLERLRASSSLSRRRSCRLTTAAQLALRQTLSITGKKSEFLGRRVTELPSDFVCRLLTGRLVCPDWRLYRLYIKSELLDRNCQSSMLVRMKRDSQCNKTSLALGKRIQLSHISCHLLHGWNFGICVDRKGVVRQKEIFLLWSQATQQEILTFFFYFEAST